MSLISSNSDNINLNNVYPSCVDTRNSHYIVVDDIYVGGLLITNYNSEMDGGFLNGLIDSDIDFDLSIFYEKQNSYQTVKSLTGIISNTGADLKTASKNQLDIDLISTTYENAKYIKRQLQVCNDDLYCLNIYLVTRANSLKALESNIQKLEGKVIGVGLECRRAIFREEEVFKSCLPILYNSSDLKSITKRNVLSSGIVSTYPFLSNKLCDDDGVLYGRNELNNSIVMVDRFDTDKYKNSNMCVIGSSGSGKSYFTKLMIARNRLLNIDQYVIDPDREYINICNELGGSIINFGKDNLINVMEIREVNLEAGENFLQNKLQKLMTFFSMIFPNLTDEEKSVLEDKIIQVYQEKGISFDNSSLYSEGEIGRLVKKKIFKKPEEMPLLEDLYKLLLVDSNLKHIARVLKPYISGSLSFMNGITNVDLSNKLIVTDIHNIEEQYLPIVLVVVTEFYWDKIRQNRGRKKIIYFDEVWRLINKNRYTADFVFKIFKTIRKYGGAATAITQDINDFFSLDDGVYGKGILNNSNIKCIFQVEENDVKILKDVMNLSENEVYRILNADRGTCLMYAGKSHLLVKIIASEYEHKFISTDRKDL